jgi:hypothetical protein
MGIAPAGREHAALSVAGNYLKSIDDIDVSLLGCEWFHTQTALIRVTVLVPWQETIQVKHRTVDFDVQEIEPGLWRWNICPGNRQSRVHCISGRGKKPWLPAWKNQQRYRASPAFSSSLVGLMSTLVNRVKLAVGQPLPVYPRQRTLPDQSGSSASCHEQTCQFGDSLPTSISGRSFRTALGSEQ